MEPAFSNRGQIAQTACAIVSTVVGISSLTANLIKLQIPSWVFGLLVGVLVVCLAVPILNIYVGWWRIPAKPNRPSSSPDTQTQSAFVAPPSVLLQTIGFAYLPSSPLDHGWKQAYRFNNVTPAFSAVHVGSETRLNMIVGETFAMQHAISRNAQLSKRVIFSVVFHQNTMLFLEFALRATHGGIETRHVKIDLGRVGSMITPDYPQEFTLWVEGAPQSDGWRLLDLSLLWVVEQTWGRHGFELEKIMKIRVRGSVAISPVLLFE